MISPPPAASVVWDALTVVAASVERDTDLVHEDAASPEEVVQVTRALVQEIQGHSTDPVPPSNLARRLLAHLRTRLIVEVARQDPLPDTAELLGLLLTMGTIEVRLYPGWDQRFSERLSGPDGLELVVEVANDLRSPLTSILFLAETLLRGRSGPVTPIQERQLGLVYGAAFGLNAVASDVVELVRGRDRLTDLNPMPFSVGDMFESVRDIVRPIAEEKNLEMRLELPTRLYRIGYPVALNRVLLNLTTNALKFTEEGLVELGASEVSEQGVEFWVRDTGRGIPPKAMALLFEPFRRRQREREYAFSGSGLELSI
ncbi:MAG: HAMP domain-containing sensor histidine kinase, partial [Gemmatimonadota bacterium]